MNSTASVDRAAPAASSWDFGEACHLAIQAVQADGRLFEKLIGPAFEPLQTLQGFQTAELRGTTKQRQAAQADYCSRLTEAGKQRLYVLPAQSLELLAEQAFTRLQFGFRQTFLDDLQRLATANDSSPMDQMVCRQLLENCSLAGGKTWPTCQDTGTAAVYGWRGSQLLSDSAQHDRQHLQAGMLKAWQHYRLRNSQLLPRNLYDEHNSNDNSPLLTELFHENGSAYQLLFTAKGGGSSNKTRLFQKTKELLQPAALNRFFAEMIEELGVSACPPYTIGIAIGGQSPEQCLLAARLASMEALDALPQRSAADTGTASGIFRDSQSEELVLQLAADSGWGAQFGGRALARAARVLRLPRHAASLPVGLAVSCAAHRQLYARIEPDGVYLEKVGKAAQVGPAEQVPELHRPGAITPTADHALRSEEQEAAVLQLDTITAESLARLCSGQLVQLHGSIILARDAAHSRLQQLLDTGQAMPHWAGMPVYYASPTGTPEGCVIGSLGPTTSRRMDGYCENFLSHGLFPLMLGKGERGEACRAACLRHGGVYLAAVGGAAALAALKVSAAQIIDWPELGMEAVRKVRLNGLLAMVIIDSRGNDFYASRPRSAEQDAPDTDAGVEANTNK